MSRLEELIQQLCPDGVEYSELGAVATIIRGGNFQKKDFVAEGFPCIHYGQIYTKYDLFVNSTISHISFQIAQKQKKAVHGDIIMAVTSENIEDVCKSIAWLGNGEVAVSGHTAIIHHEMNPKFLVYYLNSSLFFQQKLKMVQGTKVMEVSPEKLKKVKIPLPPLPVQQEIVRILDTFTELTAELNEKLTAELAARKKQYEYYRDELLHKSSFRDVRVCKLGEVANIHTGSKPAEILEDYSEFEYINAGTSNSGYVKTPNSPGDTVTTPSRGQGGIGFVGYQSRPFHLGPLCYSIRSNDENIVTNKFIYYWLSSHAGDILAFKKEGGTPALNRGDLMGLRLCVPHISVQHRIVSILDRFDALCNDLTSGLPAEMEARRKQYEYYRDKLLSFKVKA